MEGERARRVEAIVGEALAREGKARAAYLETACGVDADVRREVESLLRGADDGPALLDPLGWASAGEALAPGTRLGPYEIQSAIGAGGMGEVYQARDTRLGRTVAIKVLPPDLASDPERRRRFEHEARAASALNHPHICTLHDVGDAIPAGPRSPVPDPGSSSVSYLVLEYLDGQTLAERLAKGPLLVAQALELGAQIAEALGAAHRQGIVHRDLKPANVMLTKASTPNGSGAHVKLLDFGLAKLRAHGEQPLVASAAAGPSASASLTARGEILGTWPYMAPEQVEGKPADVRTDIWALGAVLYEMLTGARPFTGEGAASVVGAILEREPEPLATRRPDTPPALDRLVRKCLAKDPDARWQDARDVADELHWIRNTLEQGGRGQASIARLPWARTKLAGGAVSAAVVLVAATAWMLPRMMPAPSVQRYELTTTPAGGLRGSHRAELVMGLNRPSRTSLALSPDGQTLVFAGIQGTETRLYRRRLSDETAVPLDGTEGADCPFFSPDGAWIGFWAGGALRKVSIDGGFPIKLRETPRPSGGSWGAENVIALAPQDSEEGLTLIRATGGELVKILRPDSESGEHGRYVLPHFVPDSDVLLVTWVQDYGFSEDLSAVVAVSLSTDVRRTLVREAADARYLPTGHLAYVKSGRLEAVRFDPKRLAVTGEAIPLLSDVMQAWNSGSTLIDTGAAQIAVSDRSGTLVYVTGGHIPDLRSRLVWVDRRGDIVETLPPEGPIYAPQLSPEGDRIAYATGGLRPGLWYLDLVRRTPTSIAAGDVPRPSMPRWYPDGKRLMFTAAVKGRRQQYHVALGGRGAADLVRPLPAAWAHFTGSWTPGGDELVYHCQRGDQPYALCRLRLDGATWERGLLLESKGSLNWPALSPDGRWLAYVSNETGTNEVYVRRYPSLEGQLRLSDDSGRAPVWRRDGRELFYPTDGTSRHMMSVDVAPDAASPFGTPRMLFHIAEGLYTGTFAVAAYDVSLDGQRFLFVQRTLEPTPPPPSRLHVVLNWFEEVKAKAATAGGR